MAAVKKGSRWVKEIEWLSEQRGVGCLTNVSLMAGGGDVRDLKQPVHVPQV